ncbi:GNAT family N-acetyltransferase [Clostridium botulinum]|uniref:Acetyltransferase n=1 Tax=Clostridium botulinum (strain Hall / ATCC 3502 / NCTC 13319 / Type A) TaxID=441771 RepID=A5I0H1_CLOBH|nr:GNAT family N-acetyltransferase [Clostridium botulinum]EPS48647.1 acetyltransferase [Clostridium botulinum CFSAN002369]EPS52013.1 acetyltransferase [Clostridium botulinum CFSAN002367]ABS34007.1 acetyltransferase, GNAT family [Clostridium botulinum A str. ATCC 19397]ABS37872.1 acetyltransferase, GNAT family [Clostridium botulinum A str. Hall]AWB16897.1 GNAT family N-acetyltransferase [Clostridium botulinum]
MNIRIYQSEDCREIVELFYNTVHSINSRDYNSAQLDVWAPKEIDIVSWDKSFSQHCSIVAEESDVIIGFGDLDATGYLDRLYVHKDYQGIGVATTIVSELENYAQENHISIVTTNASITAKPFFKKRGYEVVKEQFVERNGQFLKNFIMKKVLR